MVFRRKTTPENIRYSHRTSQIFSLKFITSRDFFIFVRTIKSMVFLYNTASYPISNSDIINIYKKDFYAKLYHLFLMFVMIIISLTSLARSLYIAGVELLYIHIFRMPRIYLGDK